MCLPVGQTAVIRLSLTRLEEEEREEKERKTGAREMLQHDSSRASDMRIADP